MVMNGIHSSTINFVFLSCHFPPRFRFFVEKMKQAGVNVLGIGDESYGILKNSSKVHLFVHSSFCRTLHMFLSYPFWVFLNSFLWTYTYNLHHDLKSNLKEYFKVHNMEDYDQVQTQATHIHILMLKSLSNGTLFPLTQYPTPRTMSFHQIHIVNVTSANRKPHKNKPP